MITPEDRLRNANPVAGTTFTSSDFTHLYAKAMATPKPNQAFWRGFQLRLAGAAATAAAVVAAAVTALGGSSTSIPVLSFASASSSDATHAGKSTMATAPIEGIRVMNSNYVFSVGAAVSSDTSSAPVFSLQAPSDLVANLTQIGQSLGLSIGTVTLSDAGVAQSSGDYSAMEESSNGYASWNVYQSASSTSTGSQPTQPEATADAATALRDAQVATPDVTFGDATISSVSSSGVSVNVPVLLNGAPTPLSDNFEFDATGALTSASGVVFSATQGATYPLLSPVDGVAQITAQESITAGFMGVQSGVSSGLMSGVAVSPPATSQASHTM